MYDFQYLKEKKMKSKIKDRLVEFTIDECIEKNGKTINAEVQDILSNFIKTDEFKKIVKDQFVQYIENSDFEDLLEYSIKKEKELKDAMVTLVLNKLK